MSHRRMTPKGQMSSNGSGPAIMMMKPHIRATFMPDPPLQYIPPPTKSNRNHNHSGKRKQPTHIHNYDNENGNGNESTMNMNGVKPDAALVASSSDTDNNNNNNNNNNDDDPNNLPPKTSSLTGVAAFMIQLERSKPPKRTFGKTPQSVKRSKQQQQEKLNQERLAPLLEHYQDEQKKCSGEWEGMNCYNTLFVGRLAYETSERKLLRELETFGPVKDLKLITHKNKSRGYAFVEFEQEEDMKRAYRAADAMRLDGREIVVDVERGHTVPNWLPRRLGGGLGGTRLGGKEKNITAPGRFDPNKKPSHPPPLMMHHHPGMHNPPMHPMHRGGGPPGGGGGPPHGMGGPYGGTPGGPYGGPGGGPYGGGGGGGERGGFDRGGPGPGGGPGGFDRGGPPPPHPMMMGYHNGPPGGPGGFDRDRGGPPGYGGGNNRGGGNWDRDRDRDRWGGGGGGGGGPPGRGGGYNDRDRGFRRGGGGGGGGAPNDREWERGRYPPGGGPPPPNGGGSGSGGGGYSDRGMKRPRSRSNSPSSRRSRFR